MEISELGVYEVYVTSYGSAETGNYNLNIDISRDRIQMGSRDVASLEFGGSVNGSLQAGDSLSDNGQYQDSYVFQGTAGETVTVDMISSDIDTYLTLATPSGELIDNDDHNGSISQSLIEITLPESGRYCVIATSYGEAEVGSYRLDLRSGSSGSISTSLVAGEGQIYGVFAGIADYAGEDSDLPLTDQDAERARDALIEGAGMNPNNAFTLLNSDATIDNFRNALNQIAGSADEDDTLVIFYSGHGGRIERPAGPDSRDPDGFDETMVLYDYDLLDDELAVMLDQIDVGKVLLVMDACFSGGFSKDIVPGRMGLFSSEEDVLSQVALKFQAGGYLSVFFEEALTERYADIDQNGELTAIELSQYLHNRFRADVKSSFGTDEYVRASGPQANYQQLVVDRGGIGPYNVLFTRQ
ncbi:MAG: caspase family protein [Gammaproteobacteria bacterium]|nr:caspase family protein [Gammaproteobacteria bacterium]